MRHLILHFDSGETKAVQVERSPCLVSFREARFVQRKQWFADFNYLRDENERLLGLDLFTTWAEKSERFWQSPFVRANGSLSVLHDGVLRILLARSASLRVQQNMGTYASLLEDKIGNAMISAPEWGPWGALGFDLYTSDGPQVLQWEA